MRFGQHHTLFAVQEWAGCVVAYVVPNVPSNTKLWGRFAFKENAALAEISTGRLTNWQNFLSQDWAENPILGFGPGQIYPNLQVLHTDNFMVTTTIEFGPIIAAVMSGLYLFAIWSFGRKIPHAKRPGYKWPLQFLHSAIRSVC